MFPVSALEPLLPTTNPNAKKRFARLLRPTPVIDLVLGRRNKVHDLMSDVDARPASLEGRFGVWDSGDTRHLRVSGSRQSERILQTVAKLVQKGLHTYKPFESTRTITQQPKRPRIGFHVQSGKLNSPVTSACHAVTRCALQVLLLIWEGQLPQGNQGV